jgi:hypothetical protein
MKTFFEVLYSNRGNCCIICENRSLTESLKLNLENKHGFEIQCFERKSSKICELFIYKIKTLINKMGFIKNYFPRILIAKYVKLMRINEKENNAYPESPLIVVRSWADKRSFNSSDVYNDAYFGELNKKIEGCDQKYFNLLYILETMPYYLAVRKLRSVNFHWHLFEEFLDFSDIFRALSAAYKLRDIEIKKTVLSGLDISELIKDAKSCDLNTTRAESSYLSYLGAKKMFRIFNIPIFIYTFENQIWEKMLIYAIREVSKKTTIIGYAHATVISMGLFYTISLKEKNLIPLPDIIFVNGIKAKRILAESGFDERDIQIIGSIRYGGIVHSEKKQQSIGKKKILIVLSIDIERSTEMIIKCIEAFRDLDNISIIFKLHPISDPNSFTEFKSDLPQTILFTSEPITSLFESSSLVIYNDSSAAVEAAALGIPLLHIKSDFTMDMNIFENNKLIPSIRSPKEICLHALEILSDTNPKSKELKNAATEIFAPIDDELINKTLKFDPSIYQNK